jgi:small-conductance mechanosensitive channel
MPPKQRCGIGRPPHRAAVYDCPLNIMGNFIKQTFETPERVLYGNSVAEWIGAAIIALAVWAALWFLRGVVASRFKRYADIENPTVLRFIVYLISHTTQVLFAAAALYAIKENLVFPPRVERLLSNAVLLLVLLQIGLWTARTFNFYLDLKESGVDRSLAGSLNIIRFLGRILIVSLLVLVALENLGVNITALLAGLGVGGVAVALALQNILGDLFASLSIALDKPFVVGDFLTIDVFSGTVDRIGIKTTRLRSETGELIVMSNADILKSRLRNFGRARELRILATLRVPFDTPAEKLRAIPDLAAQIVGEQAFARFERCHLKTVGEWALQYELSYFRQDPDAHPLLDLQQAVNFRIIEEFRRHGIEFAYPTQRVVSSADSPRGADFRDGADVPRGADVPHRSV